METADVVVDFRCRNCSPQHVQQRCLLGFKLLHQTEIDYKASVDKLQQLLESKIDLCQQQLRAQAECLQPETHFHAPEQHN